MSRRRLISQRRRRESAKERSERADLNRARALWARLERTGIAPAVLAEINSWRSFNKEPPLTAGDIASGAAKMRHYPLSCRVRAVLLRELHMGGFGIERFAEREREWARRCSFYGV